MEFITSTQVLIQLGFKHWIYHHVVYSYNHYTMESITSTQVTITLTQWNSLPILKYPHKLHSNIVFIIMKSIAKNHYTMEFITSTQVPIQVGFKYCMNQHEINSNNHYTMESITSTEVPTQVGFKILSTSMKSIDITITQWNLLPLLKYPYKWD